jgi:dienelactone hydrolase
MRLVAALAALLAALAAGCGGGDDRAAAPARDDPLAAGDAAAFALDGATPLDVTEGETVDDVATTIVGMSFRSTGGDRVSGIVVRPRILRAGAPGVVFMHGSGGTRADFLDEAVMLASRGAVAMTIDSPWSRSEQEQVRAGYADEQTTRDLLVTNVRDLRRGLDVLVQHYEVDPGRLAIVGYSMGVQAAGLAAALDPRVGSVVLMAGRAHPSGPKGLRPAIFAQLDTVRFVGHLAPARLLVQGGTKDTVIGRAELEELFAAASEPKELRWYPAGHGLGLRSQRERIAWLSARLGLG